MCTCVNLKAGAAVGNKMPLLGPGYSAVANPSLANSNILRSHIRFADSVFLVENHIFLSVTFHFSRRRMCGGSAFHNLPEKLKSLVRRVYCKAKLNRFFKAHDPYLWEARVNGNQSPPPAGSAGGVRRGGLSVLNFLFIQYR